MPKQLNLKELGGFAASLKIGQAMKMRSRVLGGSAARVALCALAVALAGRAALASVPSASTPEHPVRNPSRANKTTGSGTPTLLSTRTHSVSTAAPADTKSRGKNKSSEHASAATATHNTSHTHGSSAAHAPATVRHSGTTSPARHAAPRLEPAASGPVMDRASRSSHSADEATGVHHDRRPAESASARAAETAHAVTPHPDAEKAGAEKATTEDFLRAAGVAREDNNAQNSSPAMPSVLVTQAPPPIVRVSAAPGPLDPTGASSPLVPGTSITPPVKPMSGKEAARNLMPADRAQEAQVIDAAITPNLLPKLFTNSGRLIVPPPMKGNHDILVHQNTMADEEGLSRIQDDADLDRMRAAHLLVPIESSAQLVVNDELPLNRRYARPWTAQLVNDIARDFYAKFHEPLHLNSAVRTVEYQLRLQRVNGNAAAVDGDAASPHLTGQAVDFGKKGMSAAQIAWMRLYLAPLMQAGKLDVEEEFQQACFHMSVYRSYAHATAPRAPKTEVAQLRAPAKPVSPAKPVEAPPAEEAQH